MGAVGPNPAPVKEKVLVIKSAEATPGPAHTPKRTRAIKIGTNRLLLGWVIDVVLRPVKLRDGAYLTSTAIGSRMPLSPAKQQYTFVRTVYTPFATAAE